MVFQDISSDRKLDLPILFSYIGWTKKYNGTERILGTHSEIDSNQAELMERNAFNKGPDKLFRCGIGNRWL